MHDFTLSADDLGRLIGTDGSQVRRLNQAKVLPRTGPRKNDKFDPFVCVPLYLDYVRRGAEKSEVVANSRQALADAQRRAIELKTKRSEGELVSIEEVAQTVEAVMTAVGASLDGIGGRLASELATLNDAAVIRERIFDEHRRIRNTAKGALEALCGSASGSESPRRPHAKKPRRMGRRESGAS